MKLLLTLAGCAYAVLLAGAAPAVLSEPAISPPTAVIGDTVYVLPADCAAATVGELTYVNCQGVWYQPHSTDDGMIFVMVDPPG